jgi:hypothetical protein
VRVYNYSTRDGLIPIYYVPDSPRKKTLARLDRSLCIFWGRRSIGGRKSTVGAPNGRFMGWFRWPLLYLRRWREGWEKKLKHKVQSSFFF